MWRTWYWFLVINAFQVLHAIHPGTAERFAEFTGLRAALEATLARLAREATGTIR